DAHRVGRLRRRRATSPRRRVRPARDGTGGAHGGGGLMSRGGAALATAHPPGVAHATAPVPASGDPIRLLRALATNRPLPFQQPTAGTPLARVRAPLPLP